MDNFPRKDHVLGLLLEAVWHSSQIGNPYWGSLMPDFEQAQHTLETLPDLKSQQALILSAARRSIVQAEKKTIALIIGDDPINGQQMSHLVRIRLICTELLNLLSEMLDRIKGLVARPWFAGNNIVN